MQAFIGLHGMFYLFVLLSAFGVSLFIIHQRFSARRTKAKFGRLKDNAATGVSHRFQKKPDWVPKELIRMKALMPQASCRYLADTFNRRFAHRAVTVSKSYVHEFIKNHLYEIRVLREKLKRRPPKAMPLNRVWGMDLTGKSDSQGRVHFILGLVEHGSRASLSLRAVRDKSSITLLRVLLDTVERYGHPKYLRTDNESVFTSRLFRFGLWMLGIRHQRIDRGCPWMNGRVERFFGTLKERLRRWEVDSIAELNRALVPFRFWYNHVRPHQNLGGRTPAEVWTGTDIYQPRRRKEYWFEAWDGLLTGYYLRC